jgi:hypothetical protein
MTTRSRGLGGIPPAEPARVPTRAEEDQPTFVKGA